MDKRQEMQLQAIYLNSRQHMKDTTEDWEKVFNSFQRELKKSGNDKAVNKKIQELIIKLEDHLRGDNNVKEIKTDC